VNSATAPASAVDEAWRPTTTEQRLRELAAADRQLAKIVAARIGLSAGLAEELAVQAFAAEDLGTLRSLASQPATPPRRLAELGGHGDEQVRRAVAGHRGTPRAALDALAADPSPLVRRAVAAREELPADLAALLLTDGSAEVRLALTRRPDPRPEHLRALAADPDPRIRANVAALGFAGDADLHDDDPRVRRTAVDRRDAGELAPHLDRLVHDPDAKVRLLCTRLAHNTTPSALAVLAADAHPAVRAGAAGNWYTPVEALKALAHDPEWKVLAQVSGNPLAPGAALATIVEAVPADFAYRPLSDWENREKSLIREVISNLLDHHATPPEALRALHAKNPPYFHEGNAASQPNWPADLAIAFGLSYCLSTVDEGAERLSYTEIEAARHTEPLDQVLATMVHCPIHYLRRAAAANRHTPPEALAELVRTADDETASLYFGVLASNPATPVGVLTTWAAAGEYHHDILKNPEAPEAVLRIIADAGGSYAGEARCILEVRAHRTGEQA
jgi:hypothetical protein